MAEPQQIRTTYIIGVVDDETQVLTAIVGKLSELEQEGFSVHVARGQNYECLMQEIAGKEAECRRCQIPFRVVVFVADKCSTTEINFGAETLKAIKRDYPEAYRIYYSKAHEPVDVGASLMDRKLADAAITKKMGHQKLFDEVRDYLEKLESCAKANTVDNLVRESLQRMELIHRNQKPERGGLKLHMVDGDYTVSEILRSRDLTNRIFQVLLFGKIQSFLE